MRRLPSKAADTRGTAALVVAMFLVILFGLAALVVDLGRLFIVRSELQNGADAGALAGVVELFYHGSDEAEASAVTFATEPGNYRITAPRPGPDAVEVSVLGPETLRVLVRRKVGTSAGAVPTIFARIWGINSAGVEAVAVATMDHRIIGTGPGNLLPFGIHKRLVDADEDGYFDIGNSVNIYPDPLSPGNFGLLDLNGGSNSNSETVSWIENGYDEVFILPESTGGSLELEGDPGISGDSLSDATNSRVGDRLLFPVFDQVEGSGSNTSFRVVDLVGGIITDVQLTGSESERRIIVLIERFSASNLVIGGPGAPSNSSVSLPILIR